ncbi:MAG: YfcE family phosphodiesterase, partial [Bacteroidales bacterium]|nr:YfcE family phosphodiesterase [Bacteroidales bacterium]
MKKIGLISDTHGYLDPEMLDFLECVDEVWHAGDIGTEEVLDYLE